MFVSTAIRVITMVAFGVPGYLLVRFRALGEEHIKAFAKFLLYACQPALTLHALDSVDSSPELIGNIGIFFAVTLVAQCVVVALYCLIFRRSLRAPAKRVCAVAGVFGNVGFIGIPLLEALLPECPEALAYSAAFSTSMNLLAWTLGLLMLTGEKKYISFRAVFVNPAMISSIAAFVLFAFGIKLPAAIGYYIETLGDMSIAVCMTVLGMRLACKSLRSIFTNPDVYVSAFFKLAVFPAITALMFALLPVDGALKSAAFILCCCPTAAMIQSLSETHGGDSATAADAVLAANLLCIFTVPLMWTAYSHLLL